jgi:hypothetical protein
MELIQDLIALILPPLLTIMVLSYLIGDNPFFRIAMHLFIGLAAGYAGSIAWHNVLKPGLIDPLFSAGLGGVFAPPMIVTVIVPWVLILILILKFSPTTARFATLPMALLVGVGAAVIVGGAISGTLIPQTLAAMQSLIPISEPGQSIDVLLEQLISPVIVILGTISTLIFFQFTMRRTVTGELPRTTFVLFGLNLPKPTVVLRWFGQVFIATTFGVMYAGALAATIIILSERIQFLWDAVQEIVNWVG